MTTLPALSERRLHRLVRRCVFGLALTLAVTGLAAMPASAADDSAAQYVLDRDEVRLGTQSFGAEFGHPGIISRPAGRLTWYRNASTGRIRGQLMGTVVIPGGKCGNIRAAWSLGNGGTSVTGSTVICGQTELVDLDSSAYGDALAVRIELRAGSPGTPYASVPIIGSRAERLMKAPDGTGTCAALDTDPAGLTALVEGKVRYFCAGDNSNDVRAKVTGILQWNSSMYGTRAKLRVQWRFFDGDAPVTLESGFVDATNPVRQVDLTSPTGSDVSDVTVTVLSGHASINLFLAQAQAHHSLGAQ